MTDLIPVQIGDGAFQIKAMEQGQIEALFRIQRSIAVAGDRDNSFYGRQLGRLGDLIDSLFVSDEDRDLIDSMFLTGKIETNKLLNAVFAAYNAHATADATPAKPAKKVAAKKVAAKKAPAKRAPRAAK